MAKENKKTNKSIIKSKGNKPLKVSAKKITKNTKAAVSKKTIGQLEEILLKVFPSETACEWDKTGLSLGDPSKKITKIAVALDPTVQAVDTAARNNCNLLLTHHPAFLNPVDDFIKSDSVAQHNGALAYSAANKGVSLMNFHTALDVSAAGGSTLPKLLNLVEKQVLVPTDGLPQNKSKLGFARVCELHLRDKGLTTEKLAARCKSVFGRAPRVWGDFSKKLYKIATNTGSCGRLSDKFGIQKQCIDQGIDCLVTGEIGYHDALALSQAGVCIIELCHDLSELPLCGVLISTLRECGIKKDDICYIDQSCNWAYQESTLI